jgi:homoprotocatechuate degradation regulator HpaR
MVLARARAALMSHFQPVLAEHGITEQQWRALRELAENGPMDATKLAKLAMVQAPSLTRILKSLEKQKLIRFSRTAGDRRRWLIEINKQGIAIVERLAGERSNIYQKIERQFGPQRQQVLLNLLDRLIAVEMAGQGAEDDSSGAT